MARAAVPQFINHQGRIAVNGVNFNGDGQFKFALVDAAGIVLRDVQVCSDEDPPAAQVDVRHALEAHLLLRQSGAHLSEDRGDI